LGIRWVKNQRHDLGLSILTRVRLLRALPRPKRGVTAFKAVNRPTADERPPPQSYEYL
jgi:hypothetical protein